MDDGGKTVNTTQNTEPWSGQKPFLTEGFNRAQFQLDNNVPKFYPGQTVTDTNPTTTAGQDAALQGAAASNTLRNATVDGAFLNQGNPYFQNMMGQIGNAIRPSIDSAFASSGRLGSGAHANAFASAMADQAGKLAYQNYGDERGRQMAAGQDYSPYQMVMDVGAQREAKQGQYIQDALNRWNFEQNAPGQALDQYLARIGGRSYGGQVTSSQPYTGNSGMQAFGTALAGLGGLGQLAAGTKGLLWGT